MSNSSNSGASIGFSGHFTMTKYKALKDEQGNFLFDEQGNHVLGEAEQVADFPNLILDSGLDKMGTGKAIEGCAVGSGGSTPVVTQTALDAVVGVTTTTQVHGEGTSNYTTEPYYSSYYRTYRFNAGQATGNLSEIGIGWGIDTTQKTITGLWSRALIKDVNGNPTTITLLSDEVLDVKYTIQLIVPQNDVTGICKIGGEDYNFIVRPFNITVRELPTNPRGWNLVTFIGNYAGNFFQQFTDGAVLYVTKENLISKLSITYPNGIVTAGSNATFRPYQSRSFQKILDSNISLNEGNVVGGIRTLILSLYGFKYQIQFSRVADGAAIPKDATKVLNIPFIISWGRANAIQ